MMMMMMDDDDDDDGNSDVATNALENLSRDRMLV